MGPDRRGVSTVRGVSQARDAPTPRTSLSTSHELRSGLSWRRHPKGLHDRMTEAETERKLAAILAADVAGYSRLMSADQVNPDFSLAQRVRVPPYENPRDLERITDGLAKAGLP